MSYLGTYITKKVENSDERNQRTKWMERCSMFIGKETQYYQVVSSSKSEQ
jgi:hypothetical protein